MHLAGGTRRPSLRYFALITAIFSAVVVLYISQTRMMTAARGREAGMRELVRILQLTDLCISTEARYTRNPAVTELTVAFQDHPDSLEHFPSGSFWTPPIMEKK